MIKSEQLSFDQMQTFDEASIIGLTALDAKEEPTDTDVYAVYTFIQTQTSDFPFTNQMLAEAVIYQVGTECCEDGSELIARYIWLRAGEDLPNGENLMVTQPVRDVAGFIPETDKIRQAVKIYLDRVLMNLVERKQLEVKYVQKDCSQTAFYKLPVSEV